MSLLTALNNSSLAMLAQSISMGQLSTNIANVNTVGYKHDDVNFKTLLSGKSSTFTSFSVYAVSDRYVEQQGTIFQTNSSLDAAVNGRGMFMVNGAPDGSGDTYYTRDGSFQRTVVNENGVEVAYLTTSAGYTVLGWPSTLNGGSVSYDTSAAPQPIRFDPAARIDGSSTTSATITGNLAANQSTQLVSIPIYGTPVTDADGNQSWPARTIKLQFVRDDPLNGESNTWSLRFVDGEGNYAGSDGLVYGPDDTPLLDENGAPIPVATFFGTIDTGSGGATVRFDENGTLIEPADGTITIDIVYGDGAETQTVSVNMRNVTQRGDSASTATADIRTVQDGYSEGDLKTIYLDNLGQIQAVYTNDRTLPMYKLALADFPAIQNLTMLSENLYAATEAAGTRRIFELGTTEAGRSALQAGALEGSTADIGDQFSRMIMTQTAYSQAATVFRTADEMTQVASSLKR